MTTAVKKKLSWSESLDSREDLADFGSSKIGLFALALRFGVEDIVACATDALVDGGGDKKNDIIFVDEESTCAVVMQCYVSEKARIAAPSNKAADLNTAMTWVLSTAKKHLPAEIRSQALRLREGVTSGAIGELHVLYVHNCDESSNVESELLGVTSGTRSLLDALGECGRTLRLSVREVGNHTLEQWYKDTHSPIVIADECKFKHVGGYSLEAPKWKAYVTAVRADELKDLYIEHGTALFSANVRDYLGSRSTDSNINYGAKKTLSDSPENFWVYNNGVTALTNSFNVPSTGGELVLQGISIVNGAQTTGAIANAVASSETTEALVPMRVVAVQDDDLVSDIVRFNNSQNQVTASDFRSTDAIQRRLKREMLALRDAEYEGGRRGGVADAIKRRANLLPSYTV